MMTFDIQIATDLLQTVTIILLIIKVVFFNKKEE